MLVPVRLIQGAGWASYSVSAQAFMAKIAPSGRRGRASGHYQAMIAVSVLVGPALGTWLYVTSGLGGPILLATGLGIVALIVSLKVRIPVQAAPTAAATAPSRRSGLPFLRALETSSLPSTLMLTTFMSGQSLFTVFAPVYAIGLGAPIELLVLYYPVYGAVLTLSHLAAAPVSDRVGRALTIRIGCVMAIGGLVVAALGGDMTALAIGAAAYAIGVSFVSSATSALTMDRAPAGNWVGHGDVLAGLSDLQRAEQPVVGHRDRCLRLFRGLCRGHRPPGPHDWHQPAVRQGHATIGHATPGLGRAANQRVREVSTGPRKAAEPTLPVPRRVHTLP